MKTTQEMAQRECPAASELAIQPLREVGTLEKTQYWSLEEIEEAIRTANQMNIDPQKLAGTASGEVELAV